MLSRWYTQRADVGLAALAVFRGYASSPLKEQLVSVLCHSPLVSVVILTNTAIVVCNVNLCTCVAQSRRVGPIQLSPLRYLICY